MSVNKRQLIYWLPSSGTVSTAVKNPSSNATGISNLSQTFFYQLHGAPKTKKEFQWKCNYWSAQANVLMMNLSGRVQICRRACSNKCCGIKSGKREREREVKKDFSKSNIEVNLITQWCCRFSFVHSKQLYLFQCTYRNGILPNSTIPLCNSTNRSTMLLDPYLSALQHVFLPVLSHLTIDELTT